ncbi:hypothetical protein M728_005338 (plasmid) [Ensifer sp. WSM1721]|uniref:DUF3991 and toprim domain-containing protein n=1 Tax=Ensifer sp. WSM1721 TaxID=1041159 RepID=UPI0004B27071|nr:DUF3991 and toprim domain-containing protein [Ensifer sp. WSM1721]
MEQDELDDLRGRVPCAAALEEAGYAMDVKESTRRAVKYRRGAEIVIVIHEGRGWFDPLSDAKGDVFSLVAHLNGVGFVEAKRKVSRLVGYEPRGPVFDRRSQSNPSAPDIGGRWSARAKPWASSATWRYLRDERFLPDAVIRAARGQDLLREGPRGSMWAAHVDDRAFVCGWEERGPDWRGFATGGSKVLFRLGAEEALRLCITEAAIDAMSLAALEGLRQGSLYLSTGGGWSPATVAAIRALAARPGAQLVAATDANVQGEVFAGRLREIAKQAGCAWFRLKPAAEDWNDTLRAKMKEEKEEREKRRAR